MQLYRGAPDPDEPAVRGRLASGSRTISSPCGSRATRAPSPSMRTSPTMRSTRSSTAAAPRRVRRERPLPARGARRHAAARPRCRPATVPVRRAPLRRRGRGGGARPPRGRRSGRGRRGPPERPPPRRARARAARAGAIAGRPRAPSGGRRRRHPTVVVGPDVPAGRDGSSGSPSARAAMFEAGVVDEVRARPPDVDVLDHRRAHPRPPGRHGAPCRRDRPREARGAWRRARAATPSGSAPGCDGCPASTLVDGDSRPASVAADIAGLA